MLLRPGPLVPALIFTPWEHAASTEPPAAVAPSRTPFSRNRRRLWGCFAHQFFSSTAALIFETSPPGSLSRASPPSSRNGSGSGLSGRLGFILRSPLLFGLLQVGRIPLCERTQCALSLRLDHMG